MSAAFPPLPIDEVLPAVCQAMRGGQRLVLAAPPGAGKTTRVPLALAGLVTGLQEVVSSRIVMLEPRRVAARLAAKQMARSLGEPLGETVGLSTRVDRKVSARTRIEVITDGLFTRRILSDPELKGVGAVIFDEFHERRLNADLGLALALESQAALNEDLRILIMSATLDTVAVAGVLDAPVIESEGRQFEVETRYLGRSQDRIEDRMAWAIRKALREEEGSVLAFLPGAREISRVAERLEDVSPGVQVAPLFGALTPAEQDAAVSPAKEGIRKIVLATDLAESAITIEGVRVVIDSGLSRVVEDDAGGLGQKLVTVKASRASVDQRRGRAGRTAPGVCYRLWDEAATRGLVAAPMPEIMTSDLSGFRLSLGEWGERDAGALTWIDAPPAGKLLAAETLLRELGALDEGGGLTARGAEMARLPLPPRLGALVASAQTPAERALAAEIAALASERGMGGNSSDLRERLARFRSDGSARAKTLRAQARRWGNDQRPGGDIATILSRGWPGQIARRREGAVGVFLMASGRAASLPETDPMSREDWLVVVDIGGSTKGGRVTLAMPLTEVEALAGAGGATTEERAQFDPKTGKFSTRRVQALGAIILSETPLPKPKPEIAAKAVLAVVREDGFAAIGVDDAVQETCRRVAVLLEAGRVEGTAVTAEGALASVDEWLWPVLRRLGSRLVSQVEVRDALLQSLDWKLQEAVRADAPLMLDLPSGQSARIDYLDPRAPLLSARAQSFYGLATHPAIAGGRVPVTLELLSPGMKPAATTRDIAAFWSAGYLDMAKDMRARYPKHDWPVDPAGAKAHEGRTKKRMQQSKD